MTSGSRVLSTVLVLISRFLGFHLRARSPVEPILAGWGSLKKTDLYFQTYFSLGCTPRGVYGLDCYESGLKIPLVP